MSGAGVSPLAFFDPQTYAKQLEIQQRQALAQMLLGNQDSSNRPYTGLKNAGNMLLGAYLLKKSAQDMGNLYSGGEASPAPQPPPQAPPQPSGGMGGAAGGLNASPPPASPQPAQFNPGPAPSAAAPTPQGGGVNDKVSQIYSNPMFPKVPGVDPTQAVMAMMEGGQSWQAYMKAYYDAKALTPEMKNIAAAYGEGSPEYNEALRGTVQKGEAILGRPGGAVIMGNKFLGIPGPTGLTPTMMANGQVGQQMAPGSGAAVTQSGFAQNLGRGATTPAIGYDAQGNPVATNQATMAGQAGAAAAAGLPGFSGPTPSPVAPAPGSRPPFAGYQAPGGLSPELSATQKPFMGHVGDLAGKAFSDTYTEAEGAPDRINVLGNIINLSRQGALSGPGTQWFGQLAGVATSMGMKNFAPTAEKYQELTKFTYQNAIRAWQVAGGTGTDTQHEAQMHANVNTEMNPGALQSIAQWALAGEKAVMGKANAQQAWMAQHGQTAQAQLAFENAWRNAMDRRVFIFNNLSGPEQQAYVQKLTPPEAKELLAKRQQLRALGAF